MSNEILLIINVLILYSGVLIWYKIFGSRGLFCWTVFATIAANIEVLILVDAFGIQQTLGNIMFATTFIVTDILSETEGKQEAQKAVNIGIFTSISFIIVSQLWLQYTPSADDWAFPSIQEIFSNTPRLMLVSLIVYVIAQNFDVWAYHKIWQATNKICKDKNKYLWLRNNGSTMLSQLLNTVLFSFGAFWGMYPLNTLLDIILASYGIFLITSLADTPVVYVARKISQNRKRAL
ncbi:queuosine precursor transporter [Aminipila sp.]|uniref:queuosine precursor transporter n=1 Tax=Aminipila sp. TaxID=2060095 RepID=UPI0028983482|nr:queuosine precursor transporter [Aminipila sp.]